jgi:hypothetical protein
MTRLTGQLKADLNHTGLCTLLKNAFATVAVGLGFCLAFHNESMEFEEELVEFLGRKDIIPFLRFFCHKIG